MGKEKQFTILIIISTILFLIGLGGTIYNELNKFEAYTIRDTSTSVIDLETEIKFEEIQTNDDETEMAETSAETSDTAISESSQEIQPIVEEIPDVYVEADGEYLTAAQSDYTKNDLMLLARIIENEAGSNWCTDEHQRAVASVVMNRVNDARFPDTVYGVISQGWNGECPIQYAVGGEERFFNIMPSERAIANAEFVLNYGATVDGAVWQSEFVQGEIVEVFAYPEIQSTITYICK